MSNVSRKIVIALPTPKVLVNNISVAGWAVSPNQNPDYAAKIVTSGALTANTLTDVFNITGSGTLKFINVYSMTATVKTGSSCVNARWDCRV